MTDPFDLPPEIAGKIPLFAEIQKVLGWSGGPVNWDLARQIAVSIAAEAGTDPLPAGADDEIAQAARLAEMWLTDSGIIPPRSRLIRARAVTSVGWAELADAELGELLEPIAAKAASAMNPHLPPGDGAAMMLRALGPMLMGTQAGAALGALACELTGTHDLGLPAGDESVTVIWNAADRVAAEWKLDAREVREVIALRAVAHVALQDAFPALRTRFYSLYHQVVSDLEIDLAAGIEKLQGLDMSDPSALQEAMAAEGLFETGTTPAAAAALAGISHVLALLDAATTASVYAASVRMSDATHAIEALARHRASATGGTDLLEGLIGLRGMPRREAGGFVRAVLAHGGPALLHRALGEDPFPEPAELADPAVWIARAG